MYGKVYFVLQFDASGTHCLDIHSLLQDRITG